MREALKKRDAKNQKNSAKAAAMGNERDSQDTLAPASFRMNSEEGLLLMAYESTSQISPQRPSSARQNNHEDGRITVDISQVLHTGGMCEWIIDSGSTEHLTKDEDSYIPDTKKPYRRCIRTATGQATYSTWIGDIMLKLWYGEGKYREIRLHDVLYVPEVKVNLLGTIRMGRRGIAVNLLPHGVLIYNHKTREILGHGLIVQNTYILHQSRDEGARPIRVNDTETIFNITQKPDSTSAVVKIKKEQPKRQSRPLTTPPTVYFLKNQDEYAEIDYSQDMGTQPFVNSTSAALNKDRVNLFT